MQLIQNQNPPTTINDICSTLLKISTPRKRAHNNVTLYQDKHNLLTTVAKKRDVDVVADRKQPHSVAKDTRKNAIGVDENCNELKTIISSIYNMNTGKRRSTTIAATPDDGKSQRKRRRRYNMNTFFR